MFKTRQAEVFTLAMKNILRDSGLLGVHNPETLSNALVYNGIALRTPVTSIVVCVIVRRHCT